MSPPACGANANGNRPEHPHNLLGLNDLADGHFPGYTSNSIGLHAPHGQFNPAFGSSQWRNHGNDRRLDRKEKPGIRL